MKCMTSSMNKRYCSFGYKNQMHFYVRDVKSENKLDSLYCIQILRDGPRDYKELRKQLRCCCNKITVHRITTIGPKKCLCKHNSRSRNKL